MVYSDNEVPFKTTIIKPEVITLDVNNADIYSGTATFRGTINNIGEPAYTERGFVYSTMPEPTINDNKIIANGSGETGNFSKYVTNLPTTTYYVRAYATSPAGTTYGNQKTISTEWVEIPSAGIAVQKKDLGSGNWETANNLCRNSRLGGYTDWRLPTKEELMILYSNRGILGRFETGYIANGLICYYYWSSSSYEDIDDDYYCLTFYNGNYWHKNSGTQNYIRAVRTLNNE